MHFSAELSETLRHERKNVRHFGTKHIMPKFLGSEVSVHRIILALVSDVDRVERIRLTLRFFDDASEFSVCSFYVVFIFS